MQFSLVELSFVSVNYDFQKITCNTNHHHPHYLSPWDLFFNCFHYSFILTNPLCLSAAKFSRFSSIKKVHFLYQNKIVYIRLIYVKILILWVDQMKKMEWKILLPFLLASCLFLLVLLNGATYWLVANAYKSMYTYLCFPYLWALFVLLQHTIYVFVFRRYTPEFLVLLFSCIHCQFLSMIVWQS